MAKDINISREPTFYFPPNLHVKLATRQMLTDNTRFSDASTCTRCGNLVLQSGYMTHIEFHARVGI